MAFDEMTGIGSTNSYIGADYTSYVERSRPRPSIATRAATKMEAVNRVLNSLGEEIAGTVEPFLKKVELTTEQVLFQEEDDLTTVYFPITAVISEFRSLEDGRMVEVAVTGNEGAVGLSSILSGSRIAHNYVQISQPGTAFSISVAQLERLMQSNERLRYMLGRHTDTYIRQISQKAICNMYHSVRERLCTWLLMVQDRSGLTKMHLTHEQMSKALGVNRPSVSRMAVELRELNLISYSRGGVKICDRERVENAACTCYFELGGQTGALMH